MVITSPERDLRSVCVFMFQYELIVVCHDQLNDQLVTLPPPLKKCVPHLIRIVVHNHDIELGYVSLAVDTVLQ